MVHDSFTLERTYPAAPERVFAAWASQRDQKSQWFGDDGEHWRPSDHTLDFRVGGTGALPARTADGTTFAYDARYQDIVDERADRQVLRDDDERAAHLGVVDDRRDRRRAAAVPGW